MGDPAHSPADSPALTLPLDRIIFETRFYMQGLVAGLDSQISRKSIHQNSLGQIYFPIIGLPFGYSSIRLMETLSQTSFPADEHTLADRYSDAITRTALSYPSDSINASITERFSDLNYFLLDGYLYNEISCRAVCSLVRSKEEISRECNSGHWAEISIQIATVAFRIRCGQQYFDANHRTAVLFIYETCADYGRYLAVDPLVLYTILSCRGFYIKPSEALRRLSTVIQTARVRADIDLDMRRETAGRVKELPRRLSMYFAFLNQLRSVTTEQRVVQLRLWKKENPTEYSLLRKCFAEELAALFGNGRGTGSRMLRRTFIEECLQMGIAFVISED